MASFFLKKFIEADNAKREQDDKIEIHNLQMCLAHLLDKNNDGSVTPNEIGDFFATIWETELRKQLNAITIDKVESDEEKNATLLLKQFCSELGLDYYYELMLEKGITTNMFINSDITVLRCALKEIDHEHLSLLYMKAQEHNEKKRFYFDLRDKCRDVEVFARKEADAV